MTEPPPLHVARYLLGIVAGLLLMFGLAWTYIATFPMTFLPSGYPVWVAKKYMLDHCDLGEIMEFGDLLLEAAIVSHGLPLVATNFSAGGVSPLDSYFLVHRALACPNHPKRVILRVWRWRFPVDPGGVLGQYGSLRHHRGRGH